MENGTEKKQLKGEITVYMVFACYETKIEMDNLDRLIEILSWCNFTLVKNLSLEFTKNVIHQQNLVDFSMMSCLCDRLIQARIFFFQRLKQFILLFVI